MSVIHATEPIQPPPTFLAESQRISSLLYSYIADVFSHARPWSEFIQWDQYRVPSSSERPFAIRRNFTAYLYNYAIASSIVLSVVMIMLVDWFVWMVTFFCCGAALYYRTRLQRAEECNVLGHVLSPLTSYGSLIGCVALLMFGFEVGADCLMVFITWGGIVSAHMLLREPPETHLTPHAPSESLNV
eukprot:PhF_6_TR39832/c0_g1_i1/m.59229/K20359/RABAC1, PRAF1; PRA1 family protein 1